MVGRKDEGRTVNMTFAYPSYKENNSSMASFWGKIYFFSICLVVFVPRYDHTIATVNSRKSVIYERIVPSKCSNFLLGTFLKIFLTYVWNLYLWILGLLGPSPSTFQIAVPHYIFSNREPSIQGMRIHKRSLANARKKWFCWNI